MIKFLIGVIIILVLSLGLAVWYITDYEPSTRYEVCQGERCFYADNFTVLNDKSCIVESITEGENQRIENMICGEFSILSR